MPHCRLTRADITTRAVVRQLSRTAVDTKNHEDLASPFGGEATIGPRRTTFQRFAAKGVEPDLVALAVADHVLTFRGDGFGTVDVVACPRGPRFKAGDDQLRGSASTGRSSSCAQALFGGGWLDGRGAAFCASSSEIAARTRL